MSALIAAATVAAVGAYAGAQEVGRGAKKAAEISAESTNKATALQEKMYQEDVARQKPFYDVGVNALPELVRESRYTPFGMDQFQQDPGYGFRLKEGLNALDRTAAARGGLLGGNQLRGAVQYGQELGSQEYLNAFNRYQTERAARLNPLQSLAGMGQSTANIIGQAGQNMANNVGNAYMNQGVNAANASLIGSNARASAYGDLADIASKGLNRYLRQPNYLSGYGAKGYGAGGGRGLDYSSNMQEYGI